jgi:hypothetical protein
MGCDRLTFFAPEDSAAVAPIILQPGQEWDLYGDTRWLSLSTWLEIDTSPAGFRGYSGILVMTYEVPTEEPDSFAWIVDRGPLQHLFPQERAEAARKQRLETLRQQAASEEIVSGPDDSTPRFVQSYCIYRGPEQVRCLACYTDLLNVDGVPIPKYRTASIQPRDVEVCRFSLHALFRLNEARLAGMKFMATPQLDVFEPAWLSASDLNPPWAKFHPLRVLRTRTGVRAIPPPENMVDGVMSFKTMQQVAEIRRIEANLHLLAFDLYARPRLNITHDVDRCMAALSHRANGGAVYVLPNRLVEEFDNTDCDEIRMKDITLPFPNLFVKFTPPRPLFLAENVPVDGCYIIKQHEEYLVSLTSHLEEVDYSRSLSVACIDPTFSIHLPAPEFKLDQASDKTDLRVNEAVEMGIEDFLEKNAPPLENISQTITRPDGTEARLEDIRAESRKRRIELFRSQEPVFRACLNIIINAACFISFRPEDISEEWDGNPPAWVIEALADNRNSRSARDRRQHAMRTISSGDYTRIKICGKNLFADGSPDNSATGQGISPRAHWRRGHWRRQRHGTGLSLVTPRWIRPTIVKKENGPMVEARIYDVEDGSGATAPSPAS